MVDNADIRILLVDDHPALRRGLSTIIHDSPGLRVVAEVSSGEEAIEAYREHRPDVTLMDLRMGGMTGTDATAAIRAEFPDAQIIILTTYEGEADIKRAIAAGARGYLLKNMLPEEYVAAIHRVHEGQRAIPTEVAAHLAEHLSDPHLSDRELEILRLVAGGGRNKQIAAQLRLADDTIKGHISNILSKLGATDRTHAVSIALRRGIIHM